MFYGDLIEVPFLKTKAFVSGSFVFSARKMMKSRLFYYNSS